MMKKSKPVISVIVPVYNVEKYLKKCVDSIRKQTFYDIEIILVDDGSEDSSGQMCDEMAEQDSRIHVIHQGNRGLSSARNTGIAVAEGEYIGFVDSDDYIEKDMYELLHHNLMREKADLSICGMYDCYQGRKCAVNTPYYQVMDAQEAIRVIFEGKSAGGASAVNKLYKKTLFQSVLYPEGKTSEDAFVIVKLLMACDCIVADSKQKYYYYHRENSITTQKFTEKQFDVIEAYQKNEILIRKYYPKIISAALGRLCWANFIVIDRMILSHAERKYEKEAGEIVSFLRRHCRDVMYCRFLTKSRKISMLVLMVSFTAYRRLSLFHAGKKLRLNISQ